MGKVMRDQEFTHNGASAQIPEQVLLVLITNTSSSDVQTSHKLTDDSKKADGVPVLNEGFAQHTAFIRDNGGPFLNQIGSELFLQKVEAAPKEVKPARLLDQHASPSL